MPEQTSEKVALPRDLGAALRLTREARGLSYREVAGQTDLPVSVIHAIEGGSDPRWSTALRIIDWIGATA